MRASGRGAGSILFAVALLELSAAALLALSKTPIDYNAIILGCVMVFLLLFQYLSLTKIFRHLDRHLLIIANVLAGVGITVQYRLNPEIAFKQITWLALGIVCMFIAILAVRHFRFLKKPWFIYPAVLLSLILLASSLVFGKTTHGARNWFTLGTFSFQPSEFVKLMLVFLMAYMLTRYKTALRIIPLGVYVLAAVGLLMLQRDLGAAVLYTGTFLIMFYVATNNIPVTLLGLGAASGAGVASYHLFSHVRARVAVWRNPWASYETDGYQIVQGLMAMASGGFFGLGLTLGSPKLIPAYNTDYIFAVICEEFGILFGVALIAFYLVFIIRGAFIAVRCRDRFYALVAFGCTAMITLQSFIIIGGVIKLIPLTGITLPFVSYGGSSMLTCMMLLGILEAIAIENGTAEEAALGVKKR